MATHAFTPSRLRFFPRGARFAALFGVLMLLGAAVSADMLLDRSGRLETTDPKLSDNSYYDEYSIQVQAGQALTITLTSSDFDAYLKVFLPDGSSQTDDDGAGNRNSKLTITPTRAGTLRIQANSLGANEVGAYRVTVERGSTSSTPASTTPSSSTPVSTASNGGERLFDRSGALEDGDLLYSDNTLYDEYSCSVRANDRIQVRLESRDFDAYLKVILPGGRELTDDDSAGSRNSLLEFTATQNGVLRILANCISVNERGNYRVTVTRIGHGSLGSPSGTSSASGSSSSGTGSSSIGDQWTSGSLQSGDDEREDGSYQDLYRFEARAGEVVSVTVESDEFDAILWVTGPGSFSEFNDDNEGKNPRVSATLPVAGTYTAIVNSFGAGATSGSYRIRLQRGAAGSITGTSTPQTANGTARPAAASATLTAGRPVNGRLESGDQTHSDGSLMDYYTFNGRSGQTVTIRLNATDFDPYLFVTGPNSFSESNDDADGGSNSRLTVRLPANGSYRVVVNSYGEGAKEGSYTLSLTEGADGASPTTTAEPTGSRIQLGASINGSLAASDGRLTSGEYRDVFTLNLEAGQAVAVDLTAGDFDPYLFIRGPEEFKEDNDDFEGSSAHSRIEFVAPTTGAYRIYTTSYRAAELGNYRLIVTDPAGGRTVSNTTSNTGNAGGTTITAGQSVSGRLQTGDGTLQSGEFRDQYTITGRAGDRLTISMTSSDLDAYLFIRGPQSFSESNDDAVEGQRDARLNVTLPANGTYQVYATSYRAGEEGAYRLDVTSGGSGSVITTAPDNSGRPSDPVAATGGTRVFGIFVGISDYPGTANDLPLCADDARKLAQVLRDAGVSSTAEQRVFVDNQATVANVRRAFQELGARCGPNDLFIFFYSGHGSQTEDMAGSQERDRREESIVLYDNEISDDEMARLLEPLRARVQVIGLDACFSGGFRDALTRPEQMGLFSSEEDLTSAVASKFEAGGYLSIFLREGLLGSADFDRNDVVTAGELSEYLYRKFAAEVTGVESETMEGEKSYQHIVIDRGGVKVGDMLVTLRQVPTGLKFRPANRGNRPSVSGTSVPVRSAATGSPAAVRGNTTGSGRTNRNNEF